MVRKTAKIAVLKGMIETMIATCADVVLLSAEAINIGQINTPPKIVNRKARKCACGNFGALKAMRRGTAKVAAITGRTKAVKIGLKPSIAILVSGKESEKKKIPIRA